MREIAEKNSRDSSSMRVLTIITMIYLPCTIVSVSHNIFIRSTVTKPDDIELLLDTIRQSERSGVWWYRASVHSELMALLRDIRSSYSTHDPNLVSLGKL
jgi:hypothetical protein